MSLILKQRSMSHVLVSTHFVGTIDCGPEVCGPEVLKQHTRVTVGWLVGNNLLTQGSSFLVMVSK